MFELLIKIGIIPSRSEGIRESIRRRIPEYISNLEFFSLIQELCGESHFAIETTERELKDINIPLKTCDFSKVRIIFPQQAYIVKEMDILISRIEKLNPKKLENKIITCIFEPRILEIMAKMEEHHLIVSRSEFIRESCYLYLKQCVPHLMHQMTQIKGETIIAN